jgi:hypothetical protein
VRFTVAFSLTLAGLLSCLVLGTARAQDAPTGSGNSQGSDITSDPRDPVVELQRIVARRAVSESRPSLFRTSPLTPIREGVLRLENRLDEATDIRFGTAVNHLFQQLSESLPGEDTFGMSSAMTLVGTWDLYNKGCPNQGELTLGIDGRWGYGVAFPADLGPDSLGSLGFTANQFSEYNPSFIVRNLFWRQGSRDAGWMYRIGRITPDAMLSSSAHINGLTTYLPVGGSGPFAMGLPDSGLGMAAGLFLSDHVNVMGLVSDANANRFDFGDLGEGDLFAAVELQVKILPLTKNAGYSTITFWHNDGTEDGVAINGSSGREGWGLFIKHEQELTCDGRAVAIGRWGRSYNESALYNQQANAHFLLYDPFLSGQYNNQDLTHADVIGTAYTWVQPSAAGSRGESNVELFYRVPLFPYTDMTLSYQAIIDPVLDPSNDFASVFSLRLRSTF